MAETFPHRGDVWYVYTPGQPDDPHQPRPALVISENTRNRRSDDVIVVPIFSTGRASPTHVTLEAGVGGVPQASILFCEELATLDRDFLHDGPLGPGVPASMLEETVNAIIIAVGGDPRT
jgi:mRNA-degrading endonuclease toxin of MazEF toxin-antitoxin module